MPYMMHRLYMRESRADTGLSVKHWNLRYKTNTTNILETKRNLRYGMVFTGFPLF